MNNERNFKGVWIPKEIWLCKDLTPLEKIYLVEIDSLDDEINGCFASNKHFENLFGQQSGNISRIISNLKDKGWISVDYIYHGKEIEKRIIKVNRPPYPSRYYQNDSRVLSKLGGGYYKNDNDSITYIDNNNNNYNNSLFEFLEQNFARTFNPIEIEEISTWEDSDLTRYAIKKAVLNNKYNINYISKILYNYKKQNIKSVQDALAQDERYQNKKQCKKVQPEWFNKDIETTSEDDEETFDDFKDFLKELDNK